MAELTRDADGRTERMITIAELVLMKERRDALREALKTTVAAIQPIREGERNGAVFGNLSIAEDKARAVLDSVREMEEATCPRS